MADAFKMLHPRLRDVLVKLGYRTPTPVQEKAIPIILRGSHTLIVAPTGSGKTEAALFPVFSRMLERELHGLHGVVALYITPLRALNRDIFRRMEYLAHMLGFTIAIRHGDTPQSARAKIASNPPDILITTPETLQFLLVHDRMRRALRTVRWVIIDEVHELLDSKRGTQLAIALERLFELSRHGFQRIGLSATIGDVEVARRFLGGVGRFVEVVEIKFPRGMEIKVEAPNPSEDDILLAEELSTTPSVASRIRRIVELVEKANGVLVFTNTRDTAEVLSSRLKKLLGEKVRVHHGSLSKDERITAEEEFKNRRVKALVCTSSLELGIDIGHVDLVVQYMSPRQALRLVQRVGRSGHRLEEKPRGVVVAYENFDDIIESLVLARRAVNGDLEKPRVHENSYDVLAHQLVGIAMENGNRVKIDYAYEIVRRAYPYRNLSKEEFIEVLEQLESQGLVRIDGEYYRLGKGSYKYYYGTSMIPDVKHYRVRNIVTRNYIGELDEEFVVTSLEPGYLFILGGRVWRTVGIDHDSLIVDVEPVEKIEGVPPAWEGELIPVDYWAAREVMALRRRLADTLKYSEEKAMNILLKEYNASIEAAEKVLKILREHVEQDKPIPSDKNIVIEATGDLIIVHIGLGSMGNQALGIILSTILSRKLGISVGYKSDQYHVVLIPAYRINPKLVVDALKGLNEGDVRSILNQALPKTNMYKWRLLHVARRFGVVSKDASLRQIARFAEQLAETVIGREALREVYTEKIDVNAVDKFIEELREGKLNIVVIESGNNPLPLTRELLSNIYLQDVVAPGIPAEIIVELVKKRLMNRKVKMVCLMCGWSKVERINDIEEIVCPNCTSRFIAITYPDDDLEKIVTKNLRGVKLKREERQKLSKAKEIANLVLTYGKYAVIALAAHGVGPKTAVKVLSRLVHGGEKEFYKAILEAEREYARTKPYWKT